MKNKSSKRHQTTQQPRAPGTPRTRRAHKSLFRTAAAIAALLSVAACNDGSARSEEASITAVSESIRIYAGIRQEGIVLGDPQAPITLIEFADLSCSHCRKYTLQVLPEIVNRYVRPGQVRIVFRNLSFLGPNSVRAARMAAAVGLQNHLWEFVDVFIRDRSEPHPAGKEVDDQLLLHIAQRVPDVDPTRALTDCSSAAVDQQLAEANKESARLDVDGVPAFFVGRTGAEPRKLRLSSMTLKPFSEAFTELLQQPRSDEPSAPPR